MSIHCIPHPHQHKLSSVFIDVNYSEGWPLVFPSKMCFYVLGGSILGMGIDWEEVYRREESKVFHQGLVSLLAMGAESRLLQRWG